MFWRKKKIPPESYAGKLSQQMQSDQRFSEAIEFYNGVLKTILSTKEGFIRDGLKEDFEKVQQAGAMFMLASAKLNLVREPANIPDYLADLVSEAESLEEACDRLVSSTIQSSSHETVDAMMDGLKQAMGHVVANAEKEYGF
jgi:hypothetical protein